MPQQQIHLLPTSLLISCIPCSFLHHLHISLQHCGIFRICFDLRHHSPCTPGQGSSWGAQRRLSGTLCIRKQQIRSGCFLFFGVFFWHNNHYQAPKLGNPSPGQLYKESCNRNRNRADAGWAQLSWFFLFSFLLCPVFFFEHLLTHQDVFEEYTGNTQTSCAANINLKYHHHPEEFLCTPLCLQPHILLGQTLGEFL